MNSVGVNKQDHLYSLQSLRGIAALMVLFHHCLFYFEYDSSIKYIVEVSINAHAAVVFFYVLSGYVLTLSLVKYDININNIFNFYIKRIFRIYPALWVAAIIATIYLFLFKDHQSSEIVSNWWVKNFAKDTINWLELIAGYLGFGHQLPLPIWSISVELFASVTFPFMVILLKKNNKLFFIYLFILILIAFYANNIYLKYLFCFALGSSVGLWKKDYLNKISKNKYFILIFLITTLLLFSRFFLGWDYFHYYHSFGPNIIEGLFSAILIYLIVNSNYVLTPLMNNKIVQLGDISYSLYLLHLPIMAFIAFGLDYLSQLGVINRNIYFLTFLLLTLTLIITCFLSVKVYKYIELKFIAIGKKYLI